MEKIEVPFEVVMMISSRLNAITDCLERAADGLEGIECTSASVDYVSAQLDQAGGQVNKFRDELIQWFARQAEILRQSATR